jgi:hypothetical protein
MIYWDENTKDDVEQERTNERTNNYEQQVGATPCHSRVHKISCRNDYIIISGFFMN